MFAHNHSHTRSESTRSDARYDELRSDLKKLVESLDHEPGSSFDRIKRAISQHPVAAMAAALGLAVIAFRVARRG